MSWNIRTVGMNILCFEGIMIARVASYVGEYLQLEINGVNRTDRRFALLARRFRVMTEAFRW